MIIKSKSGVRLLPFFLLPFILSDCSDLRPQSRRCLFTLHGHMDYVRTVQFHHEMPWIVRGLVANLLAPVLNVAIAFRL